MEPLYDPEFYRGRLDGRIGLRLPENVTPEYLRGWEFARTERAVQPDGDKHA